MKYIKSYRLFESRSSNILELLDLGLISPEDLPELIRDLDDQDKIELAKYMVNKYSIEATENAFNDNDIIKRAYQDNPSEFLEQFNDLTRVEKDGEIYYVDKDRLPLFAYSEDRKNSIVWVSYTRIWYLFSDVIGLEYEEIQGIIKDWLEEVYNLTGLTSRIYFDGIGRSWKRPIKE